MFINFGTSLYFHGQPEGSKSSGYPGPFTQKYGAPEVHDWEQRSRSSDIFSLGCVYIEILAQLEPALFPKGDSILEEPYHQHIVDLQRILREAEPEDPHLKPVLACCIEMIHGAKESRIKAVDLARTLASASNAALDATVFFCKDCIAEGIRELDPTGEWTFKNRNWSTSLNAMMRRVFVNALPSEAPVEPS
ncbi:hypothetical protein K469DRAFT_685977 [Zopfia rhizophila CBS 207.26]|uniref:Protein kinase domain-containing protein n=1 Tax=Zopfia rhizophila CBS 207.26 TaxID=1314779 RepID=A0A6A6E9Q1_9PEZI|nr:hypothetical protein K469DRAFT_685977 [Zopfia rhizophila CBS 207.26]